MDGMDDLLIALIYFIMMVLLPLYCLVNAWVYSHLRCSHDWDEAFEFWKGMFLSPSPSDQCFAIGIAILLLPGICIMACYDLAIIWYRSIFPLKIKH